MDELLTPFLANVPDGFKRAVSYEGQINYLASAYADLIDISDAWEEISEDIGHISDIAQTATEAKELADDANIAAGSAYTTAQSAKSTAENCIPKENGSVVNAYIADGAVSADKISPLNVTTPKLSTGAVTTEKLDSQAVTAEKLADGSVTRSKIAINAVGTDQIGRGSVSTDKIIDAAVTAAKLADESVTTSKIADGAVTAEKIAAGVILGGGVADGAVTTVKLADQSVTTIKLANGSVTASKLGGITADDVGAASKSSVSHISTICEIANNSSVVCFGDSFGAQSNGWPAQLQNFLGGTRGYRTVRNFSVSGAAFNPLDGNSFANQITTAQNSMTSDARNLVGAVVIAGGRNDSQSSGIYTAARDLINSARIAFPSARLILVPWLWGYGINDGTYNDKYFFGATVDCANASNAWRNYGGEVLDYARLWVRGETSYSNDTSDNLKHPNELGSKAIASYIAQGILGGYSPRMAHATKQIGNNSSDTYINISLSGCSVVLDFSGNISSYKSGVKVPGWAFPITTAIGECYIQSNTETTHCFVDANGVFSIYGVTSGQNIGGCSGTIVWAI